VATIRCPQCGRDNPEGLELCQFCQTPLQAEPAPPASPDESSDLLAGLASQASSAADEEMPDWLASLRPAITPEPEPEPEPEAEPESGVEEQPSAQQEEDELSPWFSRTSEPQEGMFEFDAGEGQANAGWESPFDESADREEPFPPKEEEDLSWLYNLEAAAKQQTGELQKPAPESDWTPETQSSSDSQDLGWLDRLGGPGESAPAEQPSEEPASPTDAPDWLNQLGAISEPAQPVLPEDLPQDLDWLDQLGTSSGLPPMDAAPAPSVPTIEPFEGEEPLPASGEDLGWLDQLGKPEARPQDIAGEAEPPSVPPFAEEISEAEQPASGDAEPDWLKSATEVPTMPPPGDLSMDWFTRVDSAERESTPAAPASPFEADSSLTGEDAHGLSNQDLDSLFSVDLPDWLSRPEPEESSSQSSGEGERDESLAPAELPSWVQAMRPVEAVISETAAAEADQPVETEGPLAGLHSVIPIAPIGAPRKPKPVSLTLQVSEDQQASVALLEKILESETSPRALVPPTFVQSQQWLRWALSGLILLLLSGVIFLRSQLMPASPVLSGPSAELTNALLRVPAGANVLVVVDYEPSLTGEMEAISTPLLEQIVLLSQPELSFLTTSPSGVALIERLVDRLNQPEDRAVNLGFLPGGSVGVLGFMESPQRILPLAEVRSFSEYSALVVLTDHAESGRVWIEQLHGRRQVDPALTDQSLLVVASAQAGPLLQPYVSSGQVTAMLSGLPDAARLEAVNNRPGLARSYWDPFGIGLMMAVFLTVAGSLWSIFVGLRARQAETQQG
jgi:hypothetical protein